MSASRADCAAIDDDVAMSLEDEDVVAFSHVGVARPHNVVVVVIVYVVVFFLMTRLPSLWRVAQQCCPGPPVL